MSSGLYGWPFGRVGTTNKKWRTASKILAADHYQLFCWRTRWIQINHDGYPRTCEPSQKVKIKGDSALPFSEENSQQRVTFHWAPRS